jgi:malic enzyme
MVSEFNFCIYSNTISNSRVFFVYQAAIGISDLLVLAMKEEGLPEDEARRRISLIDSKGLVVKVREPGNLQLSFTM